MRQTEHANEREFLVGYFKDENTIEEFDEVVWKIHNKTKEEFLRKLDNDYEILMAYFNLADFIGYLSFGIEDKMKNVYNELNEIAKQTKNRVGEDQQLL